MIEHNGYVIAKANLAGYYIIQYPGKGGSTPDCLLGLYTKPEYAKTAVDVYLASKVTKPNDSKSSAD